jgi:hypothetical protein
MRTDIRHSFRSAFALWIVVAGRIFVLGHYPEETACVANWGKFLRKVLCVSGNISPGPITPPALPPGNPTAQRRRTPKYH